jgi:hypothetical protein
MTQVKEALRDMRSGKGATRTRDQIAKRAKHARAAQRAEQADGRDGAALCEGSAIEAQQAGPRGARDAKPLSAAV